MNHAVSISQAPQGIPIPAKLIETNRRQLRKYGLLAIALWPALLIYFWHVNGKLDAFSLLQYPFLIYAASWGHRLNAIRYGVKTSYYGLKREVTLIAPSWLSFNRVTTLFSPITLTLPPDSITAITPEAWEGLPAWRVEYQVKGRGRTQTAYLIAEENDRSRVEHQFLPWLQRPTP